MNYVEDLTLDEFIVHKGALGILFEIGMQPHSFNELKDSSTILVSPNTLSRRLKEGQHLDLIDRIVVDGETRATIKYTPTERGKRIIKQFEDVQSKYFELKREAHQAEKERRRIERRIRELLSKEAGRKLGSSSTDNVHQDESMDVSESSSGQEDDGDVSEEDTTGDTAESPKVVASEDAAEPSEKPADVSAGGEEQEVPETGSDEDAEEQDASSDHTESAEVEESKEAEQDTDDVEEESDARDMDEEQTSQERDQEEDAQDEDEEQAMQDAGEGDNDGDDESEDEESDDDDDEDDEDLDPNEVKGEIERLRKELQLG